MNINTIFMYVRPFVFKKFAVISEILSLLTNCSVYSLTRKTVAVFFFRNRAYFPAMFT